MSIKFEIEFHFSCFSYDTWEICATWEYYVKGKLVVEKEYKSLYEYADIGPYIKNYLKFNEKKSYSML